MKSARILAKRFGLLVESSNRHLQKYQTNFDFQTKADFVLGNDPSNIGRFVERLMDHVKMTVRCDEYWYCELELALREALLNALFHGNLELSSEVCRDSWSNYFQLAECRRFRSPYCERKINVQFWLSQSQVCVTIRDGGRGFKISQIPDPRTASNRLKICGRGITLMSDCMDRVIYNQIGNQVTMIKRRVAQSKVA